MDGENLPGGAAWWYVSLIMFSRYPYPLLELLSGSQKFVAAILTAGVITGNTMLLNFAYRKVNGSGEIRKSVFIPGKTK